MSITNLVSMSNDAGIKENIENINKFGVSFQEMTEYVSPNYFKRQNFTGTQDGSNTIFTLEYPLKPDSEQIFIGGIFLTNKESLDYTISGDTITFVNPPLADDSITIFGIKEI